MGAETPRDEAPTAAVPVPPEPSTRPNLAIPWRRLVVEGAVIVASILLAFGIDAGWNDWQERTEEDRLLQAVLDDARANLALVDRNSVYHTAVLEVEREILQMAGSPPDAISAAKADSLLADLVWWLPPNWDTGALESLVTGGGLEAIDDEELRRLLTSWQSRIQFIAKVEEQEETFFNEALMPFLRAEARVAQIAQIAQTLPGGAEIASGLSSPQYGDLDFWPDKRDHRDLLMTESFQNLVLQKLWVQKDILAYYEVFAAELNELIDQLEAHSR